MQLTYNEKFELDRIAVITCNYFHIYLGVAFSKSNKPEHVQARHYFRWLAVKTTKISKAKIGRYEGVLNNEVTPPVVGRSFRLIEVNQSC